MASSEMEVKTVGDDSDVDGDSGDYAASTLKYADFKGYKPILDLFYKLVPNKTDQIVLMGLFINERFDTLREYIGKELTIPKDVDIKAPAIKIEGLLSSIRLATFPYIEIDGGRIVPLYGVSFNGPKLFFHITNDCSKRLQQAGDNFDSPNKMRCSDGPYNVGINENGPKRAATIRVLDYDCHETGKIKFNYNDNSNKRITFIVSYDGATRNNERYVYKVSVQKNAGKTITAKSIGSSYDAGCAVGKEAANFTTHWIVSDS